MEKVVLNNELKKRDLPDLLKLPNGTVVKTKNDWENFARPYWINLLLQEEYGKLPKYVKPTTNIIRNGVDFAGKGTWDEVIFTFDVNNEKHVVPTQLILPNNKPVAIFLYLNFRREIPDRYLPVEELLDNGFGIFTVCYNDITTDNDDFTNGLAGLFQKGERKETDCGKLIYWAYMASHMMDFLCEFSRTKDIPVAVAGHSRLGKTALIVGALDERFAFVCSNESGCAGSALARGRGDKGESVDFIYNRFPYWFCSNYKKYCNNEDNMPFDQHALVALTAPRAVCIGGALDDEWADNDNQFLSGVACSKVWELYGEKGIVSPDRLPELNDKFIDGKVGFFLRVGTHYHSRTDWHVYMEFVKKHI